MQTITNAFDISAAMTTVSGYVSLGEGLAAGTIVVILGFMALRFWGGKGVKGR